MRLNILRSHHISLFPESGERPLALNNYISYWKFASMASRASELLGLAPRRAASAWKLRLTFVQILQPRFRRIDEVII